MTAHKTPIVLTLESLDAAARMAEFTIVTAVALMFVAIATFVWLRLSAGMMAMTGAMSIAPLSAGLDWFYNGSASRTERGLEISLLAVVDVNARRGYSLSVRQTPAKPKSNPAPPKPSGGGRQRILSKTISDVSQYFKSLLLEPTPTASNPEADEPEQI